MKRTAPQAAVEPSSAAGFTVKRLALTGFVLSAAAVAAAYASAFLPSGAPAWAPWALAVGTTGTIVSILALGAERGGRIGRLWIPFALVALIVGGGLLLLLALPAADPEDPRLLLGLPVRAAILLYGVGLLPALIVPVAYALTFDTLTLDPHDLERIRQEAARLRAKAPTTEPDPTTAGVPESLDPDRSAADPSPLAPAP